MRRRRRRHRPRYSNGFAIWCGGSGAKHQCQPFIVEPGSCVLVLFVFLCVKIIDTRMNVCNYRNVTLNLRNSQCHLMSAFDNAKRVICFTQCVLVSTTPPAPLLVRRTTPRLLRFGARILVPRLCLPCCTRRTQCSVWRTVCVRTQLDVVSYHCTPPPPLASLGERDANGDVGAFYPPASTCTESVFNVSTATYPVEHLAVGANLMPFY